MSLLQEWQKVKFNLAAFGKKSFTSSGRGFNLNIEFLNPLYVNIE